MRRFRVALAFLLWLIPFTDAASAGGVDLEASCPADAPAGTTINIDVSLQNSICPPATANVRLVSSIAGNANQTAGGVSIFGPRVISASETASAGTQVDLCVANECTQSFNFCTTDADCCFDWASSVTPAITNVSLAAPPALDAALEGTVATYLIIAQQDDGSLGMDECLVNVVSALCGNGSVEAPEECDDSNNVSGDGCAGDCTLE